MPANTATMPRADRDARHARFVELLHSHQGMLRRLAWGFSRGGADHADLLQDMAMQLWAGFGQWDGERPFSTWARRVALNVALGRRRSAAPAAAAHEALHDAELPDAGRGPDDDAQLHQLRRAIDGLDPLNRALLLLHLDDVPYRDIGEILGLSESNVGVRLNRLKQRLRAQWEIAP